MSLPTDPSVGAAARSTCLLGEDRSDPQTLGGKGGSLAALVDAQYPVPTTGVVTTAAYAVVARDQAVRRMIEDIGRGTALSPEEVDDVFLGAAVPADLEAEIAGLAVRVAGDGRLAVRSSATVEDLAGSSFAGQYRSLLDIEASDPEAVLRSVRLVWASLWHPAPTAYRRAFGIGESDVAMAVVMMRMVPATTAGVVFTTDPGGAEASARVEAVEGLGEALVSGQRTPSAWVVSRRGGDALPAAPRRALELALSIEAMHDIPQDVEWAAVGDEVSVVQARPITVLQTDDGFDTPIDDHELTAAGIVEMVPGVLPPLRWDLNRFLLEEAFRSVLDSLGLIHGAPAEARPFVRRVRGRAAIDFDQLRAAAASAPGAVEELEAQYFGATADGGAPVQTPGRRITVRRTIETLRTQRNAIDAAEVLIHAVRALRDERPTVDTTGSEELLRYLDRLIDLAARGLAAELAVAAAAAAAYRRLELTLEDYLGAGQGGPAATRLATGRGASRVDEACAAVFGGPTWAELGTAPPQPLGPQPERDAERLAELEQRLRALPGWRRRRILTGQFVDIRIHMVRRLVAETREQLRRREEAKAAFLELGGEVRRILLEAGRRLRDDGLLRDTEDVELLSLSELRGLVGGRDGPGLDVLRRRRSWLGRYDAEGPLPVRFVGIPDREPTPLPEGDVLEGWAASPGRQRGRAQVVRSPKERLETGAILVAAATDASWSPLFVEAGAIVVERGGPLSHAAILARELGIPAVLNVEGATRRLDGLMLSVDGDQGLVVIER